MLYPNGLQKTTNRTGERVKQFGQRFWKERTLRDVTAPKATDIPETARL